MQPQKRNEMNETNLAEIGLDSIIEIQSGKNSSRRILADNELHSKQHHYPISAWTTVIASYAIICYTLRETSVVSC